jgi:hypothetical protein
MTNQKPPLFVMSHDVRCTITNDFEPGWKKNLGEIVSDLVEFDLFHLPFEYVEFRAIYADGPTRVEVQNLHLTRKLTSLEASNVFSINTPFASGTNINMADGIDRTKFPLYKMCNWSAAFLIIALATSNIEKKAVLNKMAKLGIGKKKNSSITYLHLPKILYVGGTSTGTGQTKRMHLRRGHRRKQPIGPGRTQHKDIWIAPMFINADDAFVPAVKEYRLTA